MTIHFLALDFGSGQISAVLTAYDENTGTCRVRHALREPCPSVSACYILDFQKTVHTLENIFAQMNDFVSFSPTVSVGLRGDFLSYRRYTGFQSVEGMPPIISEKDARAARENSIPATLNDQLEVVDLLPLSYTVNGKTGIQNPVGLTGTCLDAETFVSFGLGTHLNNLNRVMAAAGCEDFEATPTILTLCSTLLKEEEKRNGVLLLDIGEQNSSAALYYKGFLEEAWEMPFGAEIIVQEVADVLQNELEEARGILKDYTYGEDEIMDDLMDEAAKKLLKTVQKELIRSINYLRHKPAQIVLCGGGAEINVKNAAKNVLEARRVRIAVHDNLIADDVSMLQPAYTSALSLALRAQQQNGHSHAHPDNGKLTHVMNWFLAKVGLN